MTAALLVLASYLLGSIPSSYIIARLIKRINLREWGSGNLGATNLYRAVGVKYALIAVVLDVAKGYVPARFFPQFDGLELVEMALAYGVAAILGHIFSIWMKFRGGKGVATGGGVFLALAPVATGIAFLVWVIVVRTRKIVSLGSLVAASILPLAALLTGHRFDYVFWATLPLVGLVWWTHRENVRRLMAGEELVARPGVGEPAPAAQGDAGAGSMGDS